MEDDKMPPATAPQQLTATKSSNTRGVRLPDAGVTVTATRYLGTVDLQESDPAVKVCFRCGDPITFCQCAAEYSELRTAFREANGREPTPDEMFSLQPQTESERAYMALRGSDSFDLQRFVDAQAPIIEQVLAELRAGRKRSHWMWFVFPQMAGLGSSATAHKFAISSLAEAKAYLAHPLLGERLRECARLLNAIDGLSIHQILGAPDDLKLRSSMTLFCHATSDNAMFRAVLDKYFDGTFDPLTIAKL